MATKTNTKTRNTENPLVFAQWLSETVNNEKRLPKDNLEVKANCTIIDSDSSVKRWRFIAEYLAKFTKSPFKRKDILQYEYNEEEGSYDKEPVNEYVDGQMRLIAEEAQKDSPDYDFTIKENIISVTRK